MENKQKKPVRVQPRRILDKHEIKIEKPIMTDASAAAYREKLLASGQIKPSTEELRFDEHGALTMSKADAASLRQQHIQAGRIKPNPNYRPKRSSRFFARGPQTEQ